MTFIHTIQLVVILNLDIQEVERILLCFHSQEPLITSVWKLLELGTTKLTCMILTVLRAQASNSITQLQTSPSGSGELLPIWVVVLLKMTMKTPLLFANILQKVML